MNHSFIPNRRDFLKTGCLVGTGLILGRPPLISANSVSGAVEERVKSNIDDFMAFPRINQSLPGIFPGKVIEVHNEEAMNDESVSAPIVNKMFDAGMTALCDQPAGKSFGLFFSKDDIIGIKVNPVGAGLISTRLEVVDAVINWLRQGGVPAKNIVIWDRFDYMLADAGFTPERYPGVRIEGLQTMDEAAASGDSEDNSRWLTAEGRHISENNFDKDVYYWADVDGPVEEAYLNQHVFNGKHSYFGNLVTKELTKIINIPVFKNTGNGISMATKNLGYAAICNTARLHKPLFFDVCTEVLAHPVIRDKLVLNITDGLRAQYDGGPGAAAKFTYIYNRLFFATDPIALDLTCHNLLVEKRKQMQVQVNEHPKYTEYLRYAERLGLGIADPEKINHIVQNV